MLVNISVKCRSMHQPSANHSRGVYYMAVNTPYKTQDLKFKGCKSSFIKSFVSLFCYCYVTMSCWQNLILLSINMPLTDRQLADKIIRYLLLSKCVLLSITVKRRVHFRWLILPTIVFQREPYFDVVKVKIACYPLTVMLNLHMLNIFLSFINPP